MILSLVMIIFQTTRPHYAILGHMPNTRLYKNVKRFAEAKESDSVLIYRLDARMYFANIAFFKDSMETEMIRKGDKLELIILDAASINSIDSSAAHALHDLWEECHTRGIRFVMSGVKGPVRDALHRAGLIDQIGKDNFFLTVHEAISSVQKGESTNFENMTMQTDASTVK